MENTITSAHGDALERSITKEGNNSIRLSVILVIIGILVMLYPVVSTAWNNYQTTKASNEYAQLDKEIPADVKNAEWEEARTYNRERSVGPILDPWLNKVTTQDPSYSDYLNQLNATPAMARFIFPKIKVDLPVYHGTGEDTLQKGLGHLYGSDLPVGGEGTHSIITGHTGLSNVTMFDNLKDAEEGDVFYVQVSGQKLKYEVDQIKVVLPHETEGLRAVNGKDYITLITCTPYGINSHRLLVRAHQVPLESSDAAVFDKIHAAQWQWWMYALLAAALAVGIALAYWVWRQKRNVNAEDLEEEELFNEQQLNPMEEA